MSTVRSADPEAFLQTNVLGTFTLLKAALDCWRALARCSTSARFLHVSTDEVYGSLGAADPAFTESSPYRPNFALRGEQGGKRSPGPRLCRDLRHAGADHELLQQLRPLSAPGKLIPLMIIHALEGKPLPVYGDGSNVRDWLHVADHCDALMNVIERGRTGETYNVGGGNERNNRDVVGLICDTIDAAFAADARLAARFPSCPAAARRLLPRAHYLCDGPPRPRSPLCDRRRQAARPSSAAAAASVSRADWSRPCSGTSITSHGGVTSPAAPTQAWIDKNHGFRRAALAISCASSCSTRTIRAS